MTFDNFASTWLLGLKRTESVDSFGPNKEHVIQDVAYTYLPGTNLIATIARDPSGGDETYLLSTLNRSTRGLVTQVIQTDRLGRSREKNIAYDAIVGLFPETVTQHGLSMTTIYHPTFGFSVRSSDPNGA
ncbi:MAG: hypothetical protein QOI66_1749, partial [Myxococcales bacterium]|nr:hypothetical protein [Myxococcales bacterium]